jgi:hypothetical protein
VWFSLYIVMQKRPHTTLAALAGVAAPAASAVPADMVSAVMPHARFLRKDMRVLLVVCVSHDPAGRGASRVVNSNFPAKSFRRDGCVTNPGPVR